MSWDTPNYAVPGLMPVTSPKADTSILEVKPELLLETHVHGDDWPGVVSIGPITVNGAVPANPVAWATMTFRRRVGCTPALILSSENGEIVLDDAVGWVMSIPAVQASDFVLNVGIWEWDIKAIEATSGELYRLYSGWLQVVDAA